MTKNTDAQPNGFFSAGGGRRGAHIQGAEIIAHAHASMRRPSEPKTARARIELAPTKKKRASSSSRVVGPTPERLAKGDIAEPRTYDGFHRSVSPVERLRDSNKLDHDAKTNQAMFQAAEKLRRHFDGCAVGVKAQDLNRIVGGIDGNLQQEEAWVHHRDQFIKAKKLMGWSEAHPNRGAACIVVAVVCDEISVTEAAGRYLVPARTEVMKGAAMDRLREGLFALAIFWREI